MTLHFRTLALAGFAACAFITPVLADPPQPKIVVINRSDILRFSKVGQDIQRQMQAAATQAKADLSGQAKSIQAEERTLQHAASGVLTAVSGAGFAAVVKCVTPKVITAAEAEPLTMNALQPLPDGRFVSRARFEEGPILGAVGAAALGALVWALMLRHWRQSGLLADGGRVPQVRTLWGLTFLAVGWAALRRVLATPDGALGPFVPILGGGIEVLCLGCFWMGALETARRGRPVLSEWRLVLGIVVATIPPAVALAEWLRDWAP